MSATQIYDLASQQWDDPLAEKVLALLFTARPLEAPSDGRERDDRRHWQWLVRTDKANAGSFIWREEGQPIQSKTVDRIGDAARRALAPLVTEGLALGVAVVAKHVARDAVRIDVTITRRAQTDWTASYDLVND